NNLQRSRVVLGEIQVSSCALALRAVVGDRFTPPLVGLFDIDDLRLERRRPVVLIVLEPLVDAGITRRSVDGNLIVEIDLHRSLIVCGTGDIEGASEPKLV